MEQASDGSIPVMVNFISYLEIDINNNELRSTTSYRFGLHDGVR